MVSVERSIRIRLTSVDGKVPYSIFCSFFIGLSHLQELNQFGLVQH